MALEAASRARTDVGHQRSRSGDTARRKRVDGVIRGSSLHGLGDDVGSFRANCFGIAPPAEALPSRRPILMNLPPQPLASAQDTRVGIVDSDLVIGVDEHANPLKHIHESRGVDELSIHGTREDGYH